MKTYVLTKAGSALSVTDPIQKPPRCSSTGDTPLLYSAVKKNELLTCTPVRMDLRELCWVRKLIGKGCILYYSMYITFLKWQCKLIKMFVYSSVNKTIIPFLHINICMKNNFFSKLKNTVRGGPVYAACILLIWSLGSVSFNLLWIHRSSFLWKLYWTLMRQSESEKGRKHLSVPGKTVLTLWTSWTQGVLGHMWTHSTEHWRVLTPSSTRRGSSRQPTQLFKKTKTEKGKMWRWVHAGEVCLSWNGALSPEPSTLKMCLWIFLCTYGILSKFYETLTESLFFN